MSDEHRDESGRFASRDMNALIRQAAGRGRIVDEKAPLDRSDPAERPDGLDGGAGREAARTRESESPNAMMDRLIRQKAGRGPVSVRRAPNGLPLQDG